MNEQSIHTVIIGAGAAGIAAGACLRKKKIPFIILEKSDKIVPAWHNHYERLHLHTDKNRSELPYLGYPKSYPTYPSREQVIQYFCDYAKTFDLNPQFNAEVASLKKNNGRWSIHTDQNRFNARNVIVATGYNRVPKMPSISGLNDFNGPVVHSSSYKNGENFFNKEVLVIGLGNSGGEIAIDLFEYGARPSLSVRSPVNVIPRDLAGIPILVIAIAGSKLPPAVADTFTAPILRFLFGKLSKYGLRKKSYGPFTQIERESKIPLIDVGTLDLIERGAIKVFPAIKSIHNNTVLFDNKKTKEFDSIICATGFLPKVDDYIDNKILSTIGTPIKSGKELLPGLYFCGFRVAVTGVLREIAIEAKQIAESIGETQN